MIGRRKFLEGATTGGTLGFAALPPVPRNESRLNPNRGRLDSGTAPLVKLLEETPREKLLEEVGARIRGGAGYREVVSPLLLQAGPRLSLG